VVDYEWTVITRLDRTISSLDERLVILAPPDVAIPDQFTACEFDLERHSALIETIQRFRGSVYSEDGAVRGEHLSSDGLHLTPEDNHSWHLLLMNREGGIRACTWYREYDNRVYFDQLRLKQCALASSEKWRDTFWRAVEGEIRMAREQGLRYAEVGGWAVSPESRCTGEGLLLALATYGLGRIGGGVLGITTATIRHRSSTLLCRLGGRPLQFEDTVVPPYFDPHYDCVMEIVRFDSRQPDSRFSGLVEALHEKLLSIPVIARPYWPMMRSRGFRPETTASTSPELAA
jgi:hypothetical protein